MSKILKIVEMDKFVNDLNENLDTRVGENAINLSGGQIQRLGLARAIYKNSEIFILDEPTNSLDANNESNIINLLKKRVAAKNLKFGPSHVELMINQMPTVDIFQKHYGSYTAACESIGLKPMFGERLPESFKQKIDPQMKIFIDTREQQPLEFPNSEPMKLEFGDYAVGGADYDYTYVDRKGEQDFKSTLSKNNLKRFEYELQRTKDFDSYLFVVVESDLTQIESNNRRGAHKSNLKYVYHNMRVLNHQFSGSCQFIFTGSRKKSEEFIPKLLKLGKKLWNVDLQYYIDRGAV